MDVKFITDSEATGDLEAAVLAAAETWGHQAEALAGMIGGRPGLQVALNGMLNAFFRFAAANREDELAVNMAKNFVDHLVKQHAKPVMRH
jgi:hypothetical protein